MIRYVHTNIVAKNCAELIRFYKEVMGCRSIGETRDLRGEWLDRMTGIADAHIVGEHLVMPGYDDAHLTLEIFSYEHIEGDLRHRINACGIAHIAFEVDDVADTLNKVLAKGGGVIGELVHVDYEDGRKATFVYATDIEGNIIELQSWN